MRTYLLFMAGMLLLINTTFSHAQALQDVKLVMNDSTIINAKLYKTFKPQVKGNINKSDIIKVQVNDSVKELYPKDISGFTTGKKFYRSLQIRTAKATTYLFCEQLVSGKASLYFYGGNAFGQTEIYIFYKDREPEYYISLETKLKGGAQPNSGSSSPMPNDISLRNQMNELIYNVSDEQAFKAKFLRYFSDCIEIVNKLKQDWYTSSSVSSLFQDYNSACGR